MRKSKLRWSFSLDVGHSRRSGLVLLVVLAGPSPLPSVTHGDPVVPCCRSFLFAVSHSWRSGRVLLPVLHPCRQSLMEIQSCPVAGPSYLLSVTHGDPVVSCCRSFLFAVSHSWRSGRALLPVLPICCQSLMEIRSRPVAGPSSLPSVTHGDPVVPCCRSFLFAVSHSWRSGRVLLPVLPPCRQSLTEIRSCPVASPGWSFLVASVTHGDPVVSCWRSWLVLPCCRQSLMEIRSCPVASPGRSFPVAISHSWRSGRVLLLVLLPCRQSLVEIRSCPVASPDRPFALAVSQS